MLASRLTIKEVNRAHPIWIVKPTDFTAERAGEISVEQVVADPRFTLYCFDRENNSALFVETDDPVSVDNAVFYYQGQVEHAVGLVSMPMELFHAAAQQISEPAKGVILVHSVGRCGSTLLSKALQAIPSVHSLSEPDDLTQLVFLRAEGAPDDWLNDQISSSVKWRCKQRAGAHADFVAIKTRSEVLALADLIGPLLRDSKHLFLYRDAVSWMGSIIRGWPIDRDIYDEEKNRAMEESWSRTLPLVKELGGGTAQRNAVQLRVLAWVSCMEGYFRLSESGMPICAARFEDLTTESQRVLTGIFDFCGISDVDWTAIEQVLGRDSQAGTLYDREKRKYGRRLTSELIQDVRDVIASRPLLQTPEVRLPGTV